MKLIRNAVLAALAISFFTTAAEAQRKTPVNRPKPTAVTRNSTPFSVTKTDAQKVSNQVMNVTKFIYLLGGIAKGIEDLDKDTKANKAALDRNAANKKNFIQTIRNLRAGLAALEVDFRTKPLLRKYLVQIDGITGLSAQSEELALAGKFSESGRPLVSIVEKLADTLAVMP